MPDLWICHRNLPENIGWDTPPSSASIATGAFRSSPVVSLYAEAGEPSLAHRRDKLNLQMYTRLVGMPRTPSHSALTAVETDFLYRNWNYHAPFGFRVRQLLQSLNEDPPSVICNLMISITQLTSMTHLLYVEICLK